MKKKSNLKNLLYGVGFGVLALLPNIGLGQNIPVMSELTTKQEKEIYLNSLISEHRTDILKWENSSNLKNTSLSFYGDQVLNVYTRPNYKNGGEKTTDSYGSFDTNNDGFVNQEDLDLMNSGISNYRTDGNGDGETNSLDNDLLVSYLEGQIPYLPGDWEKLNSIERINWFENMWNNANPIQDPYELCGYNSLNFLINFAGIENIEESGIDLQRYNTTFNGGFNLPVYTIYTRAQDIAHIANGVYIGTDDPETDTPTNFDAWYFFDNTWDRKMNIGDFNMDGDSYVQISRFCYNDYGGELDHGQMPIIDFDLENNKAVAITWINPYLVTTNPSTNQPPYGQKPEDFKGEFPFDESPDNTGWPIGVGDDSGLEVIIKYEDIETNKTNNGAITDVNYYTIRNWTLEDNLSVKTNLGNQRIDSEDTTPPEYNLETGEWTDSSGGPVTALEEIVVTGDVCQSDTTITKTGTDISGNEGKYIIEIIGDPYSGTPYLVSDPHAGDTLNVEFGTEEIPENIGGWPEYKDDKAEVTMNYTIEEIEWRGTEWLKKIIFTAQNECGNVSPDVVTRYYKIPSGVGVDEEVGLADIIVYPNPTSGNVTLDLGLRYIEVRVQIKNSLGQCVKEKVYNSVQTLTVELPQPKGFYFLLVEADGIKNTIRIIKE